MCLSEMIAFLRAKYHVNMLDIVNALNQLHLMSDDKAEEKAKNHVMRFFECQERLGKDVKSVFGFSFIDYFEQQKEG